MSPPPGIRIPELRLDRDGHWFIDGERIEHARSVQVLTQNVRIAADGSLSTSIGREHAPIKVDDVPFFVTGATLSAEGLCLSLSDTSEAVFRTPELRGAADGRFYVRVKEGLAWARFSRAAYQAIMPALGEDEQGFYLLVCGKRISF
jgi:hypothetical protein